MTLAHVRALAAALEAEPWPPAIGAWMRDHLAATRAELALILVTATDENAALLEDLGAEAAALPLEALRGLLRVN